ncbi:hypothetical protein ABFA07_010146 [Porites harrisoni]
MEAFFGCRVDPNSMYKCLKGSWHKGSTLKNALAAASCLKQALRESPAVAEILRVGVQAGISEEQALMDMLFMLNFNAYGGVSGALRTCIARLYILENEYKDRMKREIITVMSNGQEFSKESLKEMPLLKNFVLEVLRMHPPVPVFFGRARDNLNLETDSEKFRVRKDELLVGNVHMAHRDESIFDQPDTFMPSRFENKALINHIIFGYGPFNEEATAQNHRCPGQDITMTVLQVGVSHLVLNCEYALKEIPQWTGKTLRRVGCPDREFKLRYFKYKPAREVAGSQVKVEEIAEVN